MSSDTCAKCGGQVIQRFLVGPNAMLLERRLAFRPAAYLMAYTCAACGFVELYAEGRGKFIPPAP